MNNVYRSFFVAAILLVGCIDPNPIRGNFYDYNITKVDTFQHAAVACAHPLASEVGRNILQQGGTAMDAAIAVNYALAVVYPDAGNIGGGGFMIIHTKENKSHAIDFREKAPVLAHRDMYLDSLGNLSGNREQIGHLAAGVPGTVAGMEMVHKKFGTMDIKQLIQPAIDLASSGFAITEKEAMGLNENREYFEAYNTQPPVFLKSNQWKAGDTLVQPDLANCLKRIQIEGARGFYEGATAQLIVEEMKRGGGIITQQDLRDYRAVEREPVIFDYKGYQVISMGLPSSGGILLRQMMEMVKPYPLSDYGFQSREALNLMVEAERRAFADRATYLGDEDFVQVPVTALTDTCYIRSRMKDFVPLAASKSADISAGIVRESEETTHFSIIDQYGNSVSLTTTINSSYGSMVVVGGAGFILNNGMDNFSAKPGSPNRFGLVGAEANSITAGKRMLSSMTPTIVVKDGKPFLIVGSPGGPTIITSVFQTLLNIIEFNMTARDAVNLPKFHHQWQPDVVYVEQDFSPIRQKDLESMGYSVTSRKTIGRVDMILASESGLVAVADKRGDDSVAGF